MLRFQPRPKHVWLSALIATLTMAVSVVVLSAFRAVERSPFTLIGESPALKGAIVCLPIVLALLWVSGRLRKERKQDHEEEPGGQAADSTLRETLERTRLILDGTLDAVVGMDMQGTITDWNARAEAMFGWTRKEAIGRKLVETIIPPQYRDAHNRGFRRFLSSSEGPFLNRRVELTALRRDGTEFPIELTISPLKIGGSYVFSSFIADITERKRTEHELETQREILQKIFDHIPAMISLFDTDGHPQLVNRAWERWRGWSLEEVRSQNVDLLAEGYPDPEYRQQVLALARKADGKWFDIKTRVRDGRVVDTSWAIVRLSDGTRIGIGKDITERKQAEEALRDSQERFRKAFDEAPIGMALVATDGRWLQVNRALCRIVGYAEQELLATDFQSITHPDDLEADLALARQLLNGDIPSYQMEKRYIHKLGHVVWIQLTGSIVRDAKGAPLYFIAQIQDITERKRAEAALHETQTRLETTFRSSPLPILVMDTNGRILRWNRSAERVFGWTEQEALGELCPTVPETGLQDFHWMIAQAIEDGNLHNLPRLRFFGARPEPDRLGAIIKRERAPAQSPELHAAHIPPTSTAARRAQFQDVFPTILFLLERKDAHVTLNLDCICGEGNDLSARHHPPQRVQGETAADCPKRQPHKDESASTHHERGDFAGLSGHPSDERAAHHAEHGTFANRPTG